MSIVTILTLEEVAGRMYVRRCSGGYRDEAAA